ncbi:MAG TPA: STAS/SEC14 domain-containing protein [Candidatus Udaeobacter sp.]|nr:STAS/SEC14 domain-containing protein [Candidatus Udaeobacter sp.]
MHKIAKEEPNLVRVEVSGKLTQDDYDKLIPGWKSAIARYGKMRLLFVMKDFHGWEPGAAWDDFRFDLKHGTQVDRVAMVGERKWQEWISKFGALFASTTVKYFDLADLAEAERWIRED